MTIQSLHIVIDIPLEEQRNHYKGNREFSVAILYRTKIERMFANFDKISILYLLTMLYFLVVSFMNNYV